MHAHMAILLLTCMHACMHAYRASDLAIVKVDSAEPLPAAEFGSSSELQLGAWVLALGSPLMLKHSVTAGIVSCVERRGAELGMSR